MRAVMGDFRAIKMSFRSNPNIGLYVYLTQRYCLAGPEVPEQEYEALERVFGVPVRRLTIAGTGLLGVFLAGTPSHILVPSIVNQRELDVLDNLGIKYAVIHTDLTALGNNIMCNAHGCLASAEYSDAERAQMSKVLGVPVKAFCIGELPIVGSCGVANAKGCLVHRGTKNFEIDMIAQTLKVPVTLGTVNLGNPYVKGGVACNDEGMIVGDLSGGPEIVNAEEALRGE